MRIRKHPNLDLWCREDGAVCLPPCYRFPKFRWTYGCPNNNGYLYIGFQGKQYRVHILIAQTYIDNPLNLPTVDHYPDRCRSNNAVSNLRWADRRTQQANRKISEDCKAKYGVRKCEDPVEYNKAHHAARYVEHRDEILDQNYSWRAKQKALGKRHRLCPDGSQHYLTDSEFAALYG